MKKLILRISVLVAVLVMAVACHKDEVTPVQSNEVELKQVTFRSFNLEELQDIHDALLARINELLNEGVFTNSNANGLIPQLENLQRFIDRGEADKANQKLESVIVAHLAGLHNGGILDDNQYAELDDIAHGIIDEGTVTDPNGKSYPWKKMADGKKWLTVNLDYWDGVDGEAGHYDLTYPYDDHWPYDGTTSEPYPGYGMLYTYDAALTACAKAFGPGWKTPTKADWDNLIFQYDAGWDMGDNFEVSTAPYDDLILGGNSGFDALLGGYRSPFANYYNLDVYGNHWSGTKFTPYALSYGFNSDTGEMIHGVSDKRLGLSCRCVKD